ncbi:NUDIX domain-containing protein [Candidatus Daviesbacteria bacterium]|nr:NUDIX domain-containing protein [Candidatus Daviesbacteria bacterium]
MKKGHLPEGEQIYRSNVSFITFRGPEFLLVNLLQWPPDYWKFPQGGVNPEESPEQAVKREFQEELGTDKIKILGKSKITRKYAWRKPINIDNKLYVGQNQTFFLVEFLGDDSDIAIKDDEIRTFCWTTIFDLKRVINRRELDFRGYWETIRSVLKEQCDTLNSYGISVNTID